jgi:hypothetical protein
VLSWKLAASAPVKRLAHSIFLIGQRMDRDELDAMFKRLLPKLPKLSKVQDAISDSYFTVRGVLIGTGAWQDDPDPEQKHEEFLLTCLLASSYIRKHPE